ncbi:glycosyltransferase family 4 protein [Shewanella vesiculosa]|uniref:Glycosyltransferase family 4 protein n=1 Tax=Shewanella vesiculosa TaxID=518738 RepID=A0ABV0FPN9_9GAMM
MSDFNGRVFHFVYNYWDYSGATQQAIKLSKGSEYEVVFINSQKNKVLFPSCNIDNEIKVIDIPTNLFFRIVYLFFVVSFKIKKNDICHFHGFHHLPLLITTFFNRLCFLKCTLEGVDDLKSLINRNPIFLNYILRNIKFINSLNKKILRINTESYSDGRKKLVIIPNGVEISESEKCISNTRNCFICVGAIVPRKNVKDVIQYYIDNYIGLGFPLYIIGPADPSMSEFNHEYYEECLELVGKHSDAIFMIGNQSKSQLYDYYKRAIAMLFFSHREGTPNVVLEAISFNCPVVYKRRDEVVSWILENIEFEDLFDDKFPSLKLLDRISSSGLLRRRALEFDIIKIKSITGKLYLDMMGELS